MAKPWWNRKKEEEDFEDWQYSYTDEKSDRREIKKAAIALLLFAAVYGLHYSGFAGESIRQGVRELVTRDTDFVYFAGRAAAWLPQGFDTQILERVRAVMARPADPMQYMSAPVTGELLSGFGPQVDAKTKREYAQNGVEYQCEVGTDVKAVSLGKVKQIVVDQTLGQIIVLEHGREIETKYGYLSEVLVAKGDRVTQGQIIAKSGEKPVILKPALYFELREQNVPVDPLQRIQGNFPSGGGKA